MRIIFRGINSSISRKKSNAIEALENALDPSLATIMIPLVEENPIDMLLALGRKTFEQPSLNGDPSKIYTHLLRKKDWVTTVLALHVMIKDRNNGVDQGILESLLESDNEHIHNMVQRLLYHLKSEPLGKEAPMDTEISIPDKIMHLRKIQIFEGLAVSELAAVASVTEEVDFPVNEVVMREGEPGDTMYLIMNGEVAVIKNMAEGDVTKEMELDRIGAGDYFGEMALIEDNVRSATIRTSEDCRFLVLDKQEFTEIVREYPQIALHMSRVLGDRLKKLHETIKELEEKIKELEKSS
jgi:hypothetical protein